MNQFGRVAAYLNVSFNTSRTIYQCIQLDK